MRVDAGVATPDAALLSLLVRKEGSKEPPKAFPAARVPDAEKMNLGRAKTRFAQTVRPADRP